VPYDLAYFRNRKRPEPDWIIPRWLKRGNTGFIIGEPKKACKSWLMLDMGIMLALQKPLWGICYETGEPLFLPSRPMRTVYFTQEDTEDDFHDRAEIRFAAGLDDTKDLLWVVPKDLGVTLDTDKGQTLLGQQLDHVRTKAGPIDLVMFDPMRRMHTGNENDSQMVGRLWRVLHAIHQEYSCSTIFSHHIIKPPTDENSKFDPSSPFAARGSGDIYGGGDAFINVVPRRARGGLAGYSPESRTIDLHFESKRSGPISPVRIQMKFGTGTVKFDRFLDCRGDTETPRIVM